MPAKGVFVDFADASFRRRLCALVAPEDCALSGTEEADPCRSDQVSIAQTWFCVVMQRTPKYLCVTL